MRTSGIDTMASVIGHRATLSHSGGAPSAGLTKAPDTAAATPGRLERAFFFVSMIVLQGAFIATPHLFLTGGAIGDDSGGSDPINQLSFGFVLLGTLLLSLAHFRPTARAALNNATYFILPVLIICSTAWSLYPALTLKRGIWTTGVCLFDLYIVTRLSLDELLAIISRTVIVSALGSVAIAIALPTLGREMGPGLDGEWRGVFAQKNQLGHVMAVGCFVQLLVMLRAARLKIGAILLLIACMGLVLLSRSATSLLSVLVAAAVTVGFACLRRGRIAVMVAAPIVVAGLVVVIAASASQTSGLSLLDRDSTLTGRTDLWPLVLQMIDMHPWAGWGFEAFWVPDNSLYDYVRKVAGWPAPNAHNGLLEVALGLGLVGVAALSFVLAWSVKRAVRLMVHGDTLGIAIFILLTMLVIGNITESFILAGVVFGWNLFTMLVFMSGLETTPNPPAALAHGSILDRAKPHFVPQRSTE